VKLELIGSWNYLEVGMKLKGSWDKAGSWNPVGS